MRKACVGLTGSVTRVEHGDAERIQTGLLSVAAGEGDGRRDRLASRSRGDRLYGVATGTCDDVTGAPAELTAQLGKILRLPRRHRRQRGSPIPAPFECTNNPDGQEADTDPYGLAVDGHTFLRGRRGRQRHREGKARKPSRSRACCRPPASRSRRHSRSVPTARSTSAPSTSRVVPVRRPCIASTRTPGALSVYATGLTRDHEPLVRVQRHVVRHRMDDRLRRDGPVAER